MSLPTGEVDEEVQDEPEIEIEGISRTGRPRKPTFRYSPDAQQAPRKRRDGKIVATEDKKETAAIPECGETGAPVGKAEDACSARILHTEEPERGVRVKKPRKAPSVPKYGSQGKRQRSESKDIAVEIGRDGGQTDDPVEAIPAFQWASDTDHEWVKEISQLKDLFIEFCRREDEAKQTCQRIQALLETWTQKAAPSTEVLTHTMAGKYLKSHIIRRTQEGSLLDPTYPKYGHSQLPKRCTRFMIPHFPRLSLICTITSTWLYVINRSVLTKWKREVAGSKASAASVDQHGHTTQQQEMPSATRTDLMQTASPRPSGSAPHMPQSTKSDVDVEVKEPLGTTSIDNEDDHKRMPTHPLLQVKDAPSRHGSATYRQIGVRGNEVPIAGPSASVLQMTSKAKPSESKQSLHVQQMMRCAANIDTREQATDIAQSDSCRAKALAILLEILQPDILPTQMAVLLEELLFKECAYSTNSAGPHYKKSLHRAWNHLSRHGTSYNPSLREDLLAGKLDAAQFIAMSAYEMKQYNHALYSAQPRT